MRFDFPIASELNRLHKEMDRLFGVRLSESPAKSGAFLALNLWDDDQHIFVEAELPGMRLADIELLVTEENELKIQGERRAPEMTDHPRRRERRFGRFSRTVRLPDTVDTNKASAEYEDGVLTVRLAKKTSPQPRRIEINAG